MRSVFYVSGSGSYRVFLMVLVQRTNEVCPEHTAGTNVTCSEEF